MPLPNDLKNYEAPDAFQLIPEGTAGWILLTMVCIGMILEPLFRVMP